VCTRGGAGECAAGGGGDLDFKITRQVTVPL